MGAQVRGFEMFVRCVCLEGVFVEVFPRWGLAFAGASLMLGFFLNGCLVPSFQVYESGVIVW